jgi:hypothetical protein
MLKKGSGNGTAGPTKSMYTANITFICKMASVTGSVIADKRPHWDFPNLSGGKRG